MISMPGDVEKQRLPHFGPESTNRRDAQSSGGAISGMGLAIAEVGQRD